MQALGRGRIGSLAGAAGRRRPVVPRQRLRAPQHPRLGRRRRPVRATGQGLKIFDNETHLRTTPPRPFPDRPCGRRSGAAARSGSAGLHLSPGRSCSSLVIVGLVPGRVRPGSRSRLRFAPAAYFLGRRVLPRQSSFWGAVAGAAAGAIVFLLDRVRGAIPFGRPCRRSPPGPSASSPGDEPGRRPSIPLSGASSALALVDRRPGVPDPGGGLRRGGLRRAVRRPSAGRRDRRDRPGRPGLAVRRPDGRPRPAARRGQRRARCGRRGRDDARGLVLERAARPGGPNPTPSEAARAFERLAQPGEQHPDGRRDGRRRAGRAGRSRRRRRAGSDRRRVRSRGARSGDGPEPAGDPSARDGGGPPRPSPAQGRCGRPSPRRRPRRRPRIVPGDPRGRPVARRRAHADLQIGPDLDGRDRPGVGPSRSGSGRAVRRRPGGLPERPPGRVGRAPPAPGPAGRASDPRRGHPPRPRRRDAHRGSQRRDGCPATPSPGSPPGGG